MQHGRKPRIQHLPPHLALLVGSPRMVTHLLRMGERENVIHIEESIWDAVEEIAADEGMNAEDAAAQIALTYAPGLPPESTIRAFVLNHYRSRGNA